MFVADRFAAQELISPLSEPLAMVSAVVVMSVLGGYWLRAIRQGQRFGGRAGELSAGLAIFVALSKVLSPQFFVILLPLTLFLTAVGVRGRIWQAGTVALGIAALTTAVFPYLFFRNATLPWALAPDLHPLPCALLLVRNFLLLGWLGWLTARLAASVKRGQIPPAANRPTGPQSAGP
jgi:hypothetical protein